MQEQINGIPNICGEEDYINGITEKSKGKQYYLQESGVDFSNIKACSANALHAQQPLIFNTDDKNYLHNAEVISNLRWMMEHQDIGDNYNAPAFKWCYSRMADYTKQLTSEGKNPKVMLEYSGVLLYGLLKMGCDDVIDNLKSVTCDPKYRKGIEWLGCPFSHAVNPSTPVVDFKSNVMAWRHYFCSIFGEEALARVKGFSPSEMALANHPDVAYEFVKTLKDCGYEWVMLQEHSITKLNGYGLDKPHLPHLLTCTNSKGDTVSIVAIIKTKGSDTKLVAQMAGYYDSKCLDKIEVGGKVIPQIVTQISDIENGNCILNEFPPKFQDIVRESSGSDTPLVNVTEYLEYLYSIGITEEDFEVVQPIYQDRIWKRFTPGDGDIKLNEVIEQLKKEDYHFHMDGNSWTNDLSWVKGYEDVLNPMEKVSALFYEKVVKVEVSTDNPKYREALFYLLCSQTSCFRYFGEGYIFTDYAREFCRRAEEVINKYF